MFPSHTVRYLGDPLAVGGGVGDGNTAGRSLVVLDGTQAAVGIEVGAVAGLVLYAVFGGPAAGGGEGQLQQLDGLGLRQFIAVEEEVKACLAAHRAEVDDGVLVCAVAQQRGDDMLHRVHLGIGQEIAGVGAFEAQIEGDHIAVNRSNLMIIILNIKSKSVM